MSYNLSRHGGDHAILSTDPDDVIRGSRKMKILAFDHAIAKIATAIKVSFSPLDAAVNRSILTTAGKNVIGSSKKC